jgi:hypothetical protein
MRPSVRRRLVNLGERIYIGMRELRRIYGWNLRPMREVEYGMHRVARVLGTKRRGKRFQEFRRDHQSEARETPSSSF